MERQRNLTQEEALTSTRHFAVGSHDKNMTITQLEDAVRSANAQTFRRLGGQWGRETGVENGNAAVAVLSMSKLNLQCFCGKLRNCASKDADYFHYISLSNGSTRGAVAVANVIDSATCNSALDLPVIVAVGINYGQQIGSNYFASSLLNTVFDNTGMRSRFTHVITDLDALCPVSEPRSKGAFHLVAANFFPWITAMDWATLNFNSIEEAAFLDCFGYADPYRELNELVSLCGPIRIVFHGANNAVPYMANEFRRRHRQPNGEIIYADNLARHSRVANAVGF